MTDFQSSWMLFVDGENLTIRAQALPTVRDVLREGPFYIPNVFTWMPGLLATEPFLDRHSAKPAAGSIFAARAHYYTSATGDDQRIASVEDTLWAAGFTPCVFKKPSLGHHTKSVDMELGTAMLSNAFRNNYSLAVLVAGDADYAPVVREVKQLGKRVILAFFEQSGLSRRLRLECDEFHDLAPILRTHWLAHSNKR